MVYRARNGCKLMKCAELVEMLWSNEVEELFLLLSRKLSLTFSSADMNKRYTE
jgi:hypothetical protein